MRANDTRVDTGSWKKLLPGDVAVTNGQIKIQNNLNVTVLAVAGNILDTGESVTRINIHTYLSLPFFNKFLVGI